MKKSELVAAHDRGDVDALMAALSDDDARIRANAAYWLRDLESDEVVSALIKALADPHTDVREATIHTLSVMDDPRVVPAIGGALVSDPEGKVRGYAAWMLGRSRKPDYVPPLLEALGDPNQSVRMQVLTALGKIGDERAVARLVEVATADPALGASLAAMEALAKLGDPSAVPPLQSLLTETDRHLAEGRYRTWFHEETPGLLRAWFERPPRAKRALQKWSAKQLVKLRASEVAPAIEDAAHGAASFRERLLLRRTARRLRRAA